jgi:Flp pilus assembly protein TadD
MAFDWFNVGKATAAGVILADQFAQQALQSAGVGGKPQGQADKVLQDLLRQADSELRGMRMNFFKRAKLANSFKWQLLEKGVERGFADIATQALVMHLMASASGAAVATTAPPPETSSKDTGPTNAKRLLAQGNSSFARGEYHQALDIYARVVELKPRDADARNNLGAALYKLERFIEADEQFRKAIQLRPAYPEALCNLGAVLTWEGKFAEAEVTLRRALKLRPNYLTARGLLGKALLPQGRTREAKPHFEKVLGKSANDFEALHGMGQIAMMEGRFEEAEQWFNRALNIEASYRMPTALAALAGLRRMTKGDKAWLERAKRVAGSGISATEESALHFAIGKYQDDVGAYSQAFQSYQRGNELSRDLAPQFRPEERTQFVDDMIRAYTRDAIARSGPGASDSKRPVFVVGMPRSGTSLTEQILASHPAARGAGELDFWSIAGREQALRHQNAPLTESQKKKLAEGYLRILAECSANAQRVVDKAPVNSDHLGMIHSVFPQARIICMRRNPIDTCLSCYFQPFTQAFNFATDLSDLEQYYRQHHRLMAHWREVLPAGSILDVPYEELVADQVAWTARMLDFVGLEWDDRCLDFQKTERGVATASTWQVRQKIYDSSVERWRKYEKFIGPLLSLQNLDG